MGSMIIEGYNIRVNVINNDWYGVI